MQSWIYVLKFKVKSIIGFMVLLSQTLSLFYLSENKFILRYKALIIGDN